MKIVTTTTQHITNVVTKSTELDGFAITLTKSTVDDNEPQFSLTIEKNGNSYIAFHLTSDEEFASLKNEGWISNPKFKHQREWQEKMFYYIVKDPDSIVFGDCQSYYFYIVKEHLYFERFYLDYWQSDLTDQYYDLYASLKNLKRLDDPNLIIEKGRWGEEIHTIPEYNRSDDDAPSYYLHLSYLITFDDIIRKQVEQVSYSEYKEKMMKQIIDKLPLVRKKDS